MEKKLSKKMEKYAHYHDLPLRIALGIIFLFAGFGKLFGAMGIEGFTGMLAGLGVPLAGVVAWIVALVEFFGAICLCLGWKTRSAAGLLAAVMVVALILVKIPGGDPSAMFTDIAILGAALSLFFTGSNKFAMEGKNSHEHFHE